MFIELTSRQDGKKQIINLAHVVAISPNGEGVFVRFVEDHVWSSYKESYELVRELIDSYMKER